MRKFNRRLGTLTPITTGTDANESFVRIRCLGYVSRIMDRYPLWGPETLEFMLWLMAPRPGKLLDLLASVQPDPELKKNLTDRANPDEQAHLLANHLARLSLRELRGLVKPVVAVLKQAAREKNRGPRSDLAANLAEFTELFGLTEIEGELCLFLAMMSSWTPVERYFDSHLDCDRYTGRKFLLAALGVTTSQFERVIHGRLRQLGFIGQDRSWLELSKECLPLINESAHAVLTREHYRELPEPTVALTKHVVPSTDLEQLRFLLAGKQATATHVLFYGTPGTGKTSFARALAAELEVPAYEVMHNAENTTEARRLGLTACLNLTNHGTGSIVVVDDADGLLNTNDGYLRRGEAQDKGWLNELLEEPGTRVIWIANRVDNIDLSVRRRFAYSLHFPVFGRRQRAQLWDSILRKHRVKRFFSAADINRLASEFAVSAGAIDVAVGKARSVGKARAAEFGGKGDLLAIIHRALAAHLTLLRDGRPPRDTESREEQYVLAALNLDCETAELMAQVQRFDTWWRQPVSERPVRNFNLLLHGPSGTGKTELARHLAHELDRPLVVKRMSDLLGSYVGETERALAAAFAQAEADEAVLLIDEADSLLFPRGRAQRSWEVSSTNEFLTQMERFRGMLVCTTNRVGDLDDAALRRFGRKIGVGYLEKAGVMALYNRMFGDVAGASLSARQERRLGELAHLTPGVFRNVRDRLWLAGGDTIDHDEILAELGREAGLCGPVRQRAAGFVV